MIKLHSLYGGLCRFSYPIVRMSSANKKLKSREADVAVGKEAVELQPVRSTTSGALAVSVHTKPNARESNIVGISPDAVEIQISAPPKDGEANAELTRFIAEILNLKKSQVSVDQGSKSREKTVLLNSDCGLTVAEVMEKLRNHGGDR